MIENPSTQKQSGFKYRKKCWERITELTIQVSSTHAFNFPEIPKTHDQMSDPVNWGIGMTHLSVIYSFPLLPFTSFFHSISRDTLAISFELSCIVQATT